jgi:beta-lactamase class C
MVKGNKKFILLTGILLVLSFLVISFYNGNGDTSRKPSEKRQHPGTPAHQYAEKLQLAPYLTGVVQEYEEIIEKLMRNTGTPGAAVAIVKDSSIIFIKGFGLKRLGSNDSVDVNTVFRIGSVSKCFASVLTGIMVHEGALFWNDPVIQYVPDFALKSEENTELLNIRHVLSHTTGLPYHTFTNAVEEGTDFQTMLYELRGVNLIGKPGKVYSYQNVAYSIIGEVLQNATGKSYNDLVKDKIFTPLGMQNASITYKEIMQNPDVAFPHLVRRRKWKTIPITKRYYNVAPAGGINASITDMAYWLKALLGNRPDVISEQTLKEIFTPVVNARSKNRSYRSVAKLEHTSYALGWRVLNYASDTIVYHGGYVNGYRSEVAINRRDKIAICILANAPGNVADHGIPEFLKLYLSRRDSALNSDELLASIHLSQP